MNTKEFIDKILREAKRERFSLIIPPEWESFVEEHIAEIFPAARVTGILVEEYTKGVAYHCTDPDNVDSILQYGFRTKPEDDEFLTFGGGVIYCWPESHDIKGAACAETAVLKVEYEGHIMRSIAIEDVDPKDEYQVLIFPDAIQSVQHIENVGKMKRLNDILIKHFNCAYYEPELVIGNDSYQDLVEMLFEVGELTESQGVIKDIVKALDGICGRETIKRTEWQSLEDILLIHFEEGFPFPEAPCCDSYNKLIDVLYDVSNLLSINVEDIVETLDDICIEDAVRDENGELVYDEQQVREIIAKRAKDEEEGDAE